MPDTSRGHKFELEQQIAAPAERVFAAFTDEKLLSTWFTREAKVDLREAGSYSNADGDRGVYLEIDPPRRVRFTWDNPGHCPGSEVSLDIAGSPASLKLVHSRLKSADEVEHMCSGWQWALDNVKLFLEEGKTVTYEEWQEAKQKS